MNGYDLIINISDLHEPFSHKHTYDFLKEIKRIYWPKAENPCVVFGGDEVTLSSNSFHPHDPAIPNPSFEHGMAKVKLKQWKKLFPKAYILESNHGSLYYRQQMQAGIPIEAMKSYNEIWEVDKNWKWVKDLTLKLSDGMYCYWHHGKSANVLTTSMAQSMSCVQFHFHEKFSLSYWANSRGLYFAMQSARLIDDDALDFNYNKLNLKRPIIGTSIIYRGQPRLIPMILDKKRNWIGEII